MERSNDWAWVDAELARITAERNAGEITELARVVASLVIARKEHAQAIRRNTAATDRFEREIAELRHELGEARREIADLNVVIDQAIETIMHLDQTQIVIDYAEVDTRVGVIERALPEIERKLKLRRRDGAWTPPT